MKLSKYPVGIQGRVLTSPLTSLSCKLYLCHLKEEDDAVPS